jgi:hypothetical protein
MLEGKGGEIPVLAKQALLVKVGYFGTAGTYFGDPLPSLVQDEFLGMFRLAQQADIGIQQGVGISRPCG